MFCKLACILSAIILRIPSKGITLTCEGSSSGTTLAAARVRSMSCRVILPFSPVPVILDISTASCLAISAARGVILGVSGPSSWNLKTSASFILPSGPVPCTNVKSTSNSFATRRADGVANIRLFPTNRVSALAVWGFPASAFIAITLSARIPSIRSGCSPACAMTANIVPTGTVSPSGTTT